MIRRLVGIIILTALVIVMVSACSILREPEEASAPIEAIPLETATDAPAETAEEQEPTEEPTVESEEPAADSEVPAADSEVPAADSEEPAEEMSGGVVIFQINPDNSSVRFEINEDLRGQLNTVVGTTNQIAGEIAFDKSDLSTAQAGIIQVNARTLITDNDFRNRAINNQILETGDYEFITFTPTAINGLPDSVEPGESVSFTLVGDLTIRDITNEAAFDVEATLVSDTELVGTASTIVTRTDYDLIIPSVPNVANVEEEVELYIDFAISSG